MKKLTTYLFLICFVGLTYSLAAKEVVFDKETKYALTAQSEFTASKGWSFDDVKHALKSPEKDVTIYFVELPVKKDIKELATEAWKNVDPKFNIKADKLEESDHGAWEHKYSVNYSTPVKDKRIVLALVRVLNGTAYINLIDAAVSGLEKRGAQVQIAINTWAPKSLKQENLSKITPKVFDKKDAKMFDSFISSNMKGLEIPGVAVAIIQDDKVVYMKGFGVKQEGRSDKVKPDTLFMIGSVSKCLTTLMVSKLVEEGKLKWSTPVRKVLPSFKLADDSITSKVLMKHTACACTGMPRQDLEFAFSAEGTTAEDAIKQMALMRPTTGFGETFQYSNHLVMLGGYAGASAYDNKKDLLSAYKEAMNDLVFKPLDMNNTFVELPKNMVSRSAKPHGLDFKENTVPISQKIEDSLYSVAPAGSIWSTVGDMSKYVIMELNKGIDENGKRLFSEEQIMLRRTPGVRINDTMSYGMGLINEKYKGLEVIWHDGGTFGFSSYMFFLPEQKIGAVILTNAESAGQFSLNIREKLFRALFEPGLKSKITSRKVTNTEELKRISLQGPEISWINSFVGNYKSTSLGKASIRRTKNGYEFVSARWTSQLGSYKDQGGDKLLVLTSAPWGGMFKLQAQKKPVKKLILDFGQMKYEFIQD
ncbi:MAG: serine hydrolase [Proteobacteria bacterium]|nr:serine hydrolase [Pseudomonadota bacterium]